MVASCYPQVIRSKEGFCLFLLTGGLYLLNNFLYCFSLRKIVILDVISIAFGFLLRALAGCFILDILPSKWLIICTFTLALFLGFGKRRMELARHEETAAFRSVLSDYSQRLLDILLAISAAVTLICYLLYTLSPETIALHQTHSLLLTIPFVILGVIRYIQLSVSGIMDGPDEVLWRDIPFLVNALLWGLTVLFVLTNR